MTLTLSHICHIHIICIHACEYEYMIYIIDTRQAIVHIQNLFTHIIIITKSIDFTYKICRIHQDRNEFSKTHTIKEDTFLAHYCECAVRNVKCASFNLYYRKLLVRVIFRKKKKNEVTTIKMSSKCILAVYKNSSAIFFYQNHALLRQTTLRIIMPFLQSVQREYEVYYLWTGSNYQEWHPNA